jgi:valacyclovir hydrolase
LLPYLRAPRRLIAIDSRGHGASTLGSGPLSYARLQADVEAVVGELGLSRFDVLGFSDGGIVALRLAASAESCIDRLVAIGTPYVLTADDPVRARYESVTAESWRTKFPESAAQYEALNPEPDLARLVRAVVPMWTDTGEDGYPGARIRTIRCPLLVVHGDDDPLVSRANSFELAQQVQGAKLFTLPFASHMVHHDQTALLMEVVERFFRRG